MQASVPNITLLKLFSRLVIQVNQYCFRCFNRASHPERQIVTQSLEWFGKGKKIATYPQRGGQYSSRENSDDADYVSNSPAIFQKFKRSRTSSVRWRGSSL